MKMKLLAAFAAFAATGAATLTQLTAAVVGRQDPTTAINIVTATAEIKGKDITGTANFVERGHATDPTRRMVEITVTVSGLTPGRHGVHLHAVGKCEPDFAAAGGHFDPGPAGNTDPDANHPYHMGDIPNLEASAKGTGTMKFTTSRVTLSDGPLSLFDTDGTAIIVHANPDQGITGAPKSGVSGGPRVACGVVMKK
jgi:Cu-Zn family superoxide dismutase